MNKKPRFKDTFAGRFYPINGIDYVSVTTPLGILSAPNIKLWEIRVGKTRSKIIAKKASNYGTKIHKFAQEVCEGIVPKPKKKYKDDVKAFIKWFNQNVEEVLITPMGFGAELTVYSDEYRVAGTMDIVCRLKRRKGIYVIDIKTGRIKPEHFLQLAAYRRLLIESCHYASDEITNRMVLHVRAGKVTEVHPDKDHPNIDVTAEIDWGVYLSTLNIWRWYQEILASKPKRKARKSKVKPLRKRRRK